MPSSEIWGDMAKSKEILPNYGRESDGSPGSDVDLSDRGRAGLPVRGGAAIENAAHNSEPQRIRARVSPADKALQPIEPAAGANGYRHFLRCGLQAHSCRWERSGAFGFRRVCRTDGRTGGDDPVGPRACHSHADHSGLPQDLS